MLLPIPWMSQSLHVTFEFTQLSGMGIYHSGLSCMAAFQVRKMLAVIPFFCSADITVYCGSDITV